MARGPSPARTLLLPALLAAGCLSLHGTAERPAVHSLRLEGAHAVPAAESLERIATRRSDRFFWGDVEYYDPDLFAADQRRIAAFYRSRGYYGARVTAPEVKPRDGTVDLVLRVEEGEPVRVAEVSVLGVEGAPEALARLRTLPIRPGDVFREDRFDEGRAALLAALTSNGYAHARVEQRAEVDEAARSARVAYTVTPGHRYRVRSVAVFGNSAIPASTVREAVYAAVQPGDWYDASRLPLAQARLFDLGVFGGVRVFPGQANDERDEIQVVTTLREPPFRTVRLGPSIGIEAARWDASLVAGWAHRNWLGGLRKLRLDARVGWSWIRNPIHPDKEGPAGLVSADFVQPNVVRQFVNLSARAEGERRLEEGYQFWAERVRLGLPIRLLGRTLAITPSVNFDYYQTTGDPTQAQVGGASQILLSCPSTTGARSESCLLSYLEQRLELDLRDDPLSARRGIDLTISLQEGFHLGSAGFRYLRLLPEIRLFLPLGSVVLAARGRIGLLQAYGGDVLPVVARLTSGGPEQRGYQTRKLSPVVPLSSGGWAAVGGTGLVDGALEARIPLAGDLGGVVFLDAGNVELAAADTWHFDHLQWAAGLGLRYASPFGPIRFDLAARLPVRSGGRWVMPTVPVVRVVNGVVEDTGQRHTEPVLGFHFSIGQAF